MYPKQVSSELYPQRYTPARPKRKHVLVRNVSAQTVKQLHETAYDRGCSLNWLICHILDEYAKKQEE